MLDLKLQNYTDWNVKSVIRLPERNCYAYRVVLSFADGTRKIRQHSGFVSKKDAEDAKNVTISELVNGTYIVLNHVKLADFLECWLERDIRQRVRSINTYESYSATVRLHINPSLGQKRLTDLNRGDIQRLYQEQAQISRHVVRQVKVVLNVALRYATDPERSGRATASTREDCKAGVLRRP